MARPGRFLIDEREVACAGALSATHDDDAPERHGNRAGRASVPVGACRQTGATNGARKSISSRSAGAVHRRNRRGLVDRDDADPARSCRAPRARREGLSEAIHAADEGCYG
jgi:hypothetical protein